MKNFPILSFPINPVHYYLKLLFFSNICWRICVLNLNQIILGIQFDYVNISGQPQFKNNNKRKITTTKVAQILLLNYFIPEAVSFTYF